MIKDERLLPVNHRIMRRLHKKRLILLKRAIERKGKDML